jgi:hypothetical protein
MITQNILNHLAQVDATPLPNSGATGDVAQGAVSTVLQILFGTLGSIALLIIVVSGLRYILAAGDPTATAQAKNTILYAVVGLAVSLAAFSIVTFVIKGVA